MRDSWILVEDVREAWGRYCEWHSKSEEDMGYGIKGKLGWMRIRLVQVEGGYACGDRFTKSGSLVSVSQLKKVEVAV
ncbi:unnamed protein product [Dovyalis caffra]|uniref:Uncharacterized protein n=1 Tax=Dovyalis caffra TaxID=77055 RepID=A0AAV1QUZ8_9ROSI|nr:unnamed protein product [Dovyalis caffra]